MDDVDRRAFLATMPLFAETLDSESLDHLAAQSLVAFFPQGTFLMSEGEFGASMFAVVEGTLTVTLLDRDGRAHEVAELGRGEIVGEMALMTGQRRSATVAAASDVVAIEIPKFALEEIFLRSPQLIDRFGAVLAGRQAGLRRVEAEANQGHVIAAQIRRFFARPRH
jgi:CRP-like cAMP-binding protein